MKRKDTPEKRTTQHNIVHTPTRRVIQETLVVKEQRRHVHPFTCKQKILLFTGQTFIFGEVGNNSGGGYGLELSYK